MCRNRKECASAKRLRHGQNFSNLGKLYRLSSLFVRRFSQKVREKEQSFTTQMRKNQKQSQRECREVSNFIRTSALPLLNGFHNLVVVLQTLLEKRSYFSNPGLIAEGYIQFTSVSVSCSWKMFRTHCASNLLLLSWSQKTDVSA